MPIRTEVGEFAKNGGEPLHRRYRLTMLMGLLITLTGCGEPSVRELEEST